MQFHDRLEASRLLARRLAPLKGLRPLVLGIPRGGVVMARVIADELEGDLDILLVRKLRAPGRPELAIGAVAENGDSFLVDHAYVRALSPMYIDQERSRAIDVLRDQRELYCPDHPALSVKGRIAVAVDDGIATGATAEAAVRALRRGGAARVVVASAVAPADAARSLRSKADLLVLLERPEDLDAVSRFFVDFSEVTDEDVIAALRRPQEARRS